MIEYLSSADDSEPLLEKNEKIQFKKLDFVTLRFLKLIGNIVGKAHLRKALYRWISVNSIKEAKL
ncbi:hypothetical protein X798_02788 [Onchocerca flexuosa]|uniref:Uncharacterized protein n=1 Tax=Onchocerca flexuosa TaxID=387005 RepID=A0A238BZX0_9BILA|nr:hypothetical protein X798_02788 [Onchocerca flexuosa]